MSENKSNLGKWAIGVCAFIIFSQVVNIYKKQEIPKGTKTYTTTNSETSDISSSAATTYKFILTECLGKDLLKPATFIVDPSSTKWKLDFNNGESIIYTIISGNQHDPLCGLNAKDNFGDRCKICIKNNGRKVTITLDYSGKVLVYKGYFEK